MRGRRGLVTSLLVAVLIAGTASGQSAAPRLLMVTYAAAFQHDAVRRSHAGTLSTAETVVAELARRSGRFEVTHVGTRAELDRVTVASVHAHSAMLFFTSGDVPLPAAVRQAILETVREGAGFIGVHGAADTWPTVREYRELLGATFDGHPWHQRVRLIVEDLAHPATRHLGQTFEIVDEIYQFRDWRRHDVQVLLRLDPRSVDVRRGKRADGDYAVAWAKSFGRGRVVYTALGHELPVWADQRFKAHLLGAIEWALHQR